MDYGKILVWGSGVMNKKTFWVVLVALLFVPLITSSQMVFVGGDLHNLLSGLQGGSSDEFYHLNSSEHTELTEWVDDVNLTESGDVEGSDLDISMGTGDLLTSGTLGAGQATISKINLGGGLTEFILNGVSLDAIVGATSQIATELQYLALQHSNTALAGSRFMLSRSRGTLANPLVVVENDSIAAFDAAAYDGTDYVLVGQIDFEVDGTPGGNDMPGRIALKTTSDGGILPTTRWTIDSKGNLKSGKGGAGVYNITTAGVVESTGFCNATDCYTVTQLLADTDTDTIWGLNEGYIYNNSDSLDFNETLLNVTIDARDGAGDTNCSVSGSCPTVVYADGSVPLTDNWEVGGYNITGVDTLNATSFNQDGVSVWDYDGGIPFSNVSFADQSLNQADSPAFAGMSVDNINIDGSIIKNAAVADVQLFGQNQTTYGIGIGYDSTNNVPIIKPLGALSLLVETGQANTATYLNVNPSGTGTAAYVVLYGKNAATGNSGYLISTHDSANAKIWAGKVGTGVAGDVQLFGQGQVTRGIVISDDGSYPIITSTNDKIKVDSPAGFWFYNTSITQSKSTDILNTFLADDDSDKVTMELGWSSGPNGAFLQMYTLGTTFYIGSASSGTGTVYDTLNLGMGLKIPSLSGTGNDYACLDENGTLYRSDAACA